MDPTYNYTPIFQFVYVSEGPRTQMLAWDVSLHLVLKKGQVSRRIQTPREETRVTEESST